MRIGHYIVDLHLPGGAGSYMRRIAAAQREAGNEVVLFNRPVTSPAADAARDEMVDVTDDADLYQQAARHRLDLLHVHALASDPRGSVVPLLRTLHGHEPYCPSGGRFLARSGMPCDRSYNLLRCAWGHLVDRCGSVRPGKMLSGFRHTWGEQSDTRLLRVLTVSHYLREQMLQNGFDDALVHALPLPLPAPAVGPAPEPPPAQGVPRFAYLGRLTPHKGVECLLRALATIRQPVHLDVAGQGSPQYERELRELAASLDLAARVTFHGWLEREPLDRLLRGARALVFPSVWQEPAGLVAFDAAVSARAVIASRVGGIPEMVFDGLTGLLVEPGDVAGMAAAIRRLADDYEMARRLGEEGRRVVAEQFSLERHMEALAHHYRQTIAGAPPRVAVAPRMEPA